MAWNARRIEALIDEMADRLDAVRTAFREEFPQAPPQPADPAWPPLPTGPVVYVQAGGDLQRAVQDATPGSIIELEPRAVFRGPIVLPRTSEATPILLRTRGDFPRRRLGLADAGLATILSDLRGTAPIACAPGAHHWVLDALAVTQTEGQTWSLIELGHGEERFADDLPGHLWLHRLVLHVASHLDQRRGITWNAFDTDIRRCSITGIKEAGFDSQAIGGRVGARLAIVDNEIQGAGENLMLGGSDPNILDGVPEDVLIADNDISKPLEWKGSEWQVKNLLEIKNGRRVTITRNRLRHCWPAAQDGVAVVLTVRNQSGRAPWSVVEDIEFSHNDVRDVAGGIQMHAFDYTHPSQVSRRFSITDNYFEIDRQGKSGRVMEGSPIDDLTIARNKAISNGSSAFYFRSDLSPGHRLRFEANAYLQNRYGFWCEGHPLERVFPDAVWEDVVIGSDSTPGLIGRGTAEVISVAEFLARYKRS